MKKVDSIELYDGIRLLVLSARQTVARGVNLLQVQTNYEIGRRIVEHEQGGADRAQYGKEVIKELAERLTTDFGNGFSKSNLEYIRRFYLAYPGRDIQISQTLSGIFGGLDNSLPSSIAQTVSGQSTSPRAQVPFTLSWSHYVFLLGLTDQERRFYEIEAAEQGWTLRDLKRQFNAGLFERLALSRDKKAIHDPSHQGQGVSRPQDILKDPYGDTSRNGNLCTLTKVFDRWGFHALASNLLILQALHARLARTRG